MIQTVKIVLDLLVIFLIVFGLFRGIRKGFVQTLYQALRWILCLILAQILYPYAADFLKQVGLFEMMQKGIEESLEGLMSGSGNTSMIQSLPLPDFLKDLLIQNDNSVVYEMLNVTTLAGYVSAYLANMALNVLSVVALLVVLLVISHLIGAALNIITKLPVIHSLNALLGGVAGLALGVINVWFFGLLVFLAALFMKWDWLSDGMAQTTLLDFCNRYNPILTLVTNFLN